MVSTISNNEFNWELALAAQTACILEADAPKVGNVNRFHDFTDASLEDFHRSALAIGRPFGCLNELGVGRTIYEAVKATRSVVSTNTNLGIVLLLAPLGMAWHRLRADRRRKEMPGQWQKEMAGVLAGLGADDTRYVYQAIRLASPAGMGQVDHYDVWAQDTPEVTLLEAMKPAAGRDLIAGQYVGDFELVLGKGYETLNRSLAAGLSLSRAIAHTHLYLLSQVQDSLISRKAGAKRSIEVQTRARAAWECGGWLTTGGQEHILEFDRWLRKDGHKLNPGTTADLMAAILFVYLLKDDPLFIPF